MGDAADAQELAAQLIREDRLTRYQAIQIAAGKKQRLVLGNYVTLDAIGVGGMGEVFKARHVRMSGEEIHAIPARSYCHAIAA